MTDAGPQDLPTCLSSHPRAGRRRIAVLYDQRSMMVPLPSFQTRTPSLRFAFA